MDKVIFFNTMIEPKGGVCSAPVIFLIVISVSIILLMVGLTFGAIYAIKNTTISLTDKELIIKSAFYGRKIPIENIMIDGIKAVNLDIDSEYDISVRTNGIGLPNFKLGWMRLKNGTRALTFLTNRNSVVLIPAKDFSVLFSMDDIEEFINKIRALKS